MNEKITNYVQSLLLCIAQCAETGMDSAAIADVALVAHDLISVTRKKEAKS